MSEPKSYAVADKYQRKHLVTISEIRKAERTQVDGARKKLEDQLEKVKAADADSHHRFVQGVREVLADAVPDVSLEDLVDGEFLVAQDGAEVKVRKRGRGVVVPLPTPPEHPPSS